LYKSSANYTGIANPMAQVAIEAKVPMAIISTPLRTQLFRLKIALLAPTMKRQAMLAIAAVITAELTSMEAKGRMGMRETTAKVKPVKRAALVGGQDYNVHSILSVSLKGGGGKAMSKGDVDVIIGRVRKTLDRGIDIVGSLEFSKGEFTYTHRTGANPLSQRSTHLLTMFTGQYYFREVRNLQSVLQPEGLTSICQVAGKKIPPFENHVYPNAIAISPPLNHFKELAQLSGAAITR
jgi:hypothetical protein